ncbi:MAG: GTP-binding protein [Candidatus Heimdallarchaeum endolithica]|uniref:GTP-binding protein n=1 Tax=Candidatus Heimdallarchaeum endolithica TaxID=2876572 RepID=A0A9Y1BTX0_9ARCH|nr:MAG: GTP-binding protein [Candidatus Heimdallarchaeum endolithica]
MTQRNYKIVLIGNALVGKTAIVTRFAKDYFEQNYLRTLVINYYIKTQIINNVEVKMIITDTAGQEAFQRLRSSYYKGARGAIIVYSINDRHSFGQVEYWKNEMFKTLNELPIIIVGNKIDLLEQRKVSTSEGRLLAKKLGCLFIESSAKTGENINEIFKMIVKDILRKDDLISTNGEKEDIQVDKEEEQKPVNEEEIENKQQEQ